MVQTQLYYDILLNICDFYRSDYGQLFRLSLVNTKFNRAASNMLYHRVVLSPPVSRLHQLNLRDTGVITSPSNLPSATLPRYADLVLELEVSGYLNPRSPPRNTLHSILGDALRKFTSIRSVKFVPATFHEDVFIDSLKLLPGFHCSLRELVLNSSCTSDEDKVSLLTEVKGLGKLSLHSPGRAILLEIPAWIKKSSSTLEELHLLDNCGSVTPGVLKSLLPHVQEHLKAFSLGLSYSITDEDTFTFLSQLPNLERLRLRYYWQMKAPIHKPGLQKLRSFTAEYGGVGFSTCREVSPFYKWVRRIVSGSQVLQTLRISAEGESEDELAVQCTADLDAEDEGRAPRPANPAFNGLVDHLVKKHPFTLRHLQAKTAFVSLRAMSSLLTECTALETVHLSVGKTAMTLFQELVPRTPCLHTASFEIQNVHRRSFKFGEEEVAKTMRQSPQLRRLGVNGLFYEGSYTVTKVSGDDEEELHSDLVVSALQVPVPPWRRG